ncbi:thiaminase II [Ornithinibacillus contaminans]|uniref:thiaminase II n=1 Tax=Ornithinibacillus contaminans TaxID=694055 RepID=UPI00064DA070|nr:thiaminase II [Ornithinibacillus contaminans]
MTFTKQLRSENDDIYQMIFAHPFVEGIGNGDIAKRAVEHYVKADFEYLNAFMKIYGIAIAKATNREEIAYFHDKIAFIVNDEIHPHRNFCDYIGIDYDVLQGHPLPPTADHYVKHMMYHAQLGSLGEILGALLPCPWTYLEIGKTLMEKHQPNQDHPFYPWISFYADSRVEKTTTDMRMLLDSYAEHISSEEKSRIKDAFRKSCQLELQFWEMAYSLEQWPAGKKVETI